MAAAHLAPAPCAGSAAVTAHSYGKGTAYYVAFREDSAFLRDFYSGILPPAIQLPVGVTLRTRRSGTTEYQIFQNWNSVPVSVEIPENWGSLFPAGEKPEQIAGWGTLVTQAMMEEE